MTAISVQWLEHDGNDNWWYREVARIEPLPNETREETLSRAEARLPADGQGMLEFEDGSYALPPFLHPDAWSSIKRYLSE